MDNHEFWVAYKKWAVIGFVALGGLAIFLWGLVTVVSLIGLIGSN